MSKFSINSSIFNLVSKTQNNLTHKVTGIQSTYPWEQLPDGVPIDASIAPFIRALNMAGYRTYVSCSGLKQDHLTKHGGSPWGYIGFENLTSDQQLTLASLFDAAGWLDGRFQFNYTYFHMCAYDITTEKFNTANGKSPTQNEITVLWLNIFMLFNDRHII